ncbi:adenylosuccinate lyase [Dehalobacterium formicoaceticum]|uniref:Adenylosuccinate lyase n=1 Tax=Dehalobacterium formicoaceticum TaxID=51515 RepID=A0ABT1Y1K2_9FIRM|nr:adenylosuccinate lyase [Dehalobacterium formicoaceticum]MCR6544738.1 adenylosuccinate lyase [Dehalobacterium formicoaceticum]
MIDRYTLPEMGSVWESENRFQKMLDAEIFACEAMADLGLIPQEAFQDIKTKASFDIPRIEEIEKVTRHDVIAFLTAVGEKVGEASKYIHMGMTSSDVLDTALSAQMREAADLLIARLRKLRSVLAEKAKKYKYTLEVGRTHGIHAEPVTFGLKMALWTMEIDRCIERMLKAKEVISVGKISGAVGTFANVDPQIEEHVCRKMGLKPAQVSTQIIQRDRHAEFLTTLALIGSSLEKFSTEIRNLQRTDILEVEEAFAKGQKGSSAMPHKKNPITAERVTGLSRVLRGNALAAMENVALWHERDITHSSVERVIIPDSCILLDYMLHLFINVMEHLNVYEENMRTNLNKTLGLVFSQRVLLTLVDKGLLRETAYEWVQRNAMIAWQTKTDFEYLILQDKDIMSYLSHEEVDSLFDYDYHTRYIDYIFQRAGL